MRAACQEAMKQVGYVVQKDPGALQEVVSKDKPSESWEARVAYSETLRQHKLPPC